MSTREFARFDAAAMYDALDAKRRALVASWSQVAAAIGPSASTIRNTAPDGIIEADGALCMLQWLGIPPAAFLRRNGEPASEGWASREPAPRVFGGRPSYLTRVDTPGLYAALDEQRKSRGLTWGEVAQEIGPDIYGAASLTRLAEGGRTEIHFFMAMAQWLAVPPETFMHRPGSASYGPVLRGRDFPGADRGRVKGVRRKTGAQ